MLRAENFPLSAMEKLGMLEQRAAQEVLLQVGRFQEVKLT